MTRNPSGEIEASDGGRASDGGLFIGPYRILKELGRGGQGVVYLAEHESQGRTVALKVLDGLASQHGATMTRFRREAQAAAALRHPGICGLVEAGVESATPYIAMEFVDGETLAKRIASKREESAPSTWAADFGDEASQAGADDPSTQLDHGSILATVSLFERAARAVHAAHEAGITHRDLKPANIMISRGGEPVILDFGLAHHDDPGLETLTRTGDMIGTPAYMSPEQLSRQLIRLDRRTDVWSLGVCLYEAVTLRRPFEAPTREGLYQAILTKEPSPASQLNALVPKDLDVVIQTALSKDRDRRYQTALDLAEDLRNIVVHAPILARPASAWTKLARWARRNPAVAALTAAVFLALAAGLVVTASLLAKVSAEKKRAGESAEAEKAAKIEAQDKREQAERNLAYAKKGNRILGSVFLGLDPHQEYRTIAELRDAFRGSLETALSELEGGAVGDPRDVAALQYNLGQSLIRLRDSKTAIPVLEKALAVLDSGSSSELGLRETLNCMTALGGAYIDVGKIEEGIDMQVEACERAREALGDDDGLTLACLGNLGLAYKNTGRQAEALPIFEEIARKSRATRGPDDPVTLKYLTYLAAGCEENGKLVRASEILEGLLPRLRALRGEDHPQTLECMNNLGMIRLSMGSPDPGLLEETLEKARGRLGADHPTTLVTMTNLGWVYRSVGRFDEAITMLESALPRMKSALGERHANTLSCWSNLASSYSAAGRAEKAIPLLESLLGLHRSMRGPDSREVLQAMNALASACGAANQTQRALELFEEAAKRMESVLGKDDSTTIVTVNNLAGAVRRAGDTARAAALYEQIVESLERIGFQHQNAARIIQNTVNALLEVGKPDKAEAWRRKWMDVVKERAGADSLLYGKELVALGTDYLARDMLEEGERAIRDGLAILEIKAKGSWEAAHAEAVLGMTLFGQKKDAEAEPLLLRGYEGLTAHQRLIPWELRPMLPTTRRCLRALYLRLGNEAEAERWKAEPGS